MAGAPAWLTAPILSDAGLRHGFGTRSSPAVEVVRPEQVHGKVVARVDESGASVPHRADAIVSCDPSRAVAIVTADCVPLLAADDGGRAVAAIHAGWRGLAAGVIEAALAELAKAGSGGLRVAIGPAIGPCCYEVDAPVLEALEASHGAEWLAASTRSSRPDHRFLDLAALAERSAIRTGVEPARVVRLPEACTACHAERFHSYRRDGEAAGRLVHFIAPIGRDTGGLTA